MLSRIINRSSFVRGVLVWKRQRHFCSFPRVANCSKLFFIAAVPCRYLNSTVQDTMENIDLKLKDACQRGEAGIIELMDFIQHNLNDVCTRYKDCLKKQITLIDEATKAGASSPKWDALPEFRSMGTDLSEQFQSFIVTINTLGELATSETLKYIMQQEKNFKLLGKKHKELEKFIKKQADEIRKLEDKVLAKTRASIEKANKQS